MTRSLYPEISPYKQDRLQVSEIHSVYYECCGNPEGIPVIVLHGGPGGGINSDYRRYFDPDKYHVVLFDQRGCGQSTPFAELRENTTWDLVEDIERIRKELKIETWAVFGGSWGSTLSLAYAQTHPEKVRALFLRGIFLLRQKEIDWFYQEGASRLFPDAWEKYLEPIPENERDDLVSAFYKRLTSEDKQTRQTAARAWSVWEASTSKLIPNDDLKERFGQDDFAEAFARIECHYFTHHGFIKRENQLIEDTDKIRNIPSIIVHGRYDVVCPVETAWELHRHWPEVKFQIIAGAGHSLSEPGITTALVQATDNYAKAGSM